MKEWIQEKLFPTIEDGDDTAIHALAQFDPEKIQQLRLKFGDPDPGKDQI